mgnify:FL=1
MKVIDREYFCRGSKGRFDKFYSRRSWTLLLECGHLRNFDTRNRTFYKAEILKRARCVVCEPIKADLKPRLVKKNFNHLCDYILNEEKGKKMSKDPQYIKLDEYLRKQEEGYVDPFDIEEEREQRAADAATNSWGEGEEL